jgi:hypothetical protein
MSERWGQELRLSRGKKPASERLLVFGFVVNLRFHRAALRLSRKRHSNPKAISQLKYLPEE